MKRIGIALLSALLLVTAGSIGAEDGAYKVIVNPANPTTQLTRLKLGEMFLKKEKRWADGQPVFPVEPSLKSATRQRFTQEVFAKSTIAVSAYWQQMIFSGKGVPPPEKSSDAEIVAFVRDTPGAIGYVGPGADLSGVKIVTIVD
jgi:ABC-type phosphate transport system substrate-binding protein